MIAFLLIGINIAISIKGFSAFNNHDRPERFMFIPNQVATGRNYMGLLLSHFSHADVSHLAFNMISLYFFAPVIQQLLGALHLLVIYAISGMCASLLVFLFHARNPNYRVLGASGSVSGVIFSAIVLYPAMNIYFFFIPIPIPAPIFGLAYIFLSAYLMRRSAGNVSHEAHIGGALAGFILAGVLSPRGFGPLVQRFSEFF